MHDPREMLTHQLLWLVAQIGYGAVGEHDLPIGVDLAYDVRNRLEQSAVHLFAFAQLVFGILAFGRIADGSDQVGAVDLVLHQVVLSAPPQSLQGSGLVRNSGAHDRGYVWGAGMNAGERL